MTMWHLNMLLLWKNRLPQQISQAFRLAWQHSMIKTLNARFASAKYHGDKKFPFCNVIMLFIHLAFHNG